MVHQNSYYHCVSYSPLHHHNSRCKYLKKFNLPQPLIDCTHQIQLSLYRYDLILNHSPSPYLVHLFNWLYYSYIMFPFNFMYIYLFSMTYSTYHVNLTLSIYFMDNKFMNHNLWLGFGSYDMLLFMSLVVYQSVYLYIMFFYLVTTCHF